MDHNQVVHATPGKGKDTIAKISSYLTTKKSPPEEIESVCIDLSPAFISGVSEEFENASIVFDRFHVNQLANQAMDLVRRRDNAMYKKELKNCKYLFLKGHDKLSKEQKLKKSEVPELLLTLH